jgi:hypothetical protein
MPEYGRFAPNEKSKADNLSCALSCTLNSRERLITLVLSLFL